MKRRWLAAVGVTLVAALAVPLAQATTAPTTTATAATRSVARPSARHVVIVGVSGLTWNLVSPERTPGLWRLAAGGSAGSLVDYAQQPLACPADGWLTLNSAARAQGPRPCAALPAVVPDDPGRGARIPALPGIAAANRGYDESPDWGLLGRLARCATAVGPGAALALASPAGAVSSYLPSVAGLSAPVLARCPLTVVDLGRTSERVGATGADRQLTRIAAELPPDTLLLVTAPGAGSTAGRPHLMTVVVHGPGFAGGLLGSTATRRPGIVTLTDLTPTVAGWLGAPVPAGTVGARLTTSGRGSLAAAVTGLRQRDTAEQVWLATHGWFFTGYAIADALAFILPALLLPGGDETRRARRARWWRIAGLVAVCVPLGSYLANALPWPELAHPAWWLYGLSAVWTLVAAGAALAGPWRRDPLGPFGAVAAATLLLLAVDVMAGSRLQLDAPYGLSLLVSGRFYGIGNDALGVYCVSGLVATAWVAAWVAAWGAGWAGRRRPPVPASGPGTPALVAAGAVGLLAVIASGWPGFGAKVGGTVALVPGLVLLVAWLAGARLGRRWAVPVAVSGLAVFAVFAVISYLLPAAGVSDMGAFAGDLLHGRAGELFQRKVHANLGSLSVSVFGWLIPVLAVLAAVALGRPTALRLPALADAFTARPLLRVLAWLCWLVLVIGWFADDSGVLVPATALPFVLPLAIGAVCCECPDDRVPFPRAAGGARYFGNASAGHPSQAEPPV